MSLCIGKEGEYGQLAFRNDSVYSFDDSPYTFFTTRGNYLRVIDKVDIEEYTIGGLRTVDGASSYSTIKFNISGISIGTDHPYVFMVTMANGVQYMLRGSTRSVVVLTQYHYPQGSFRFGDGNLHWYASNDLSTLYVYRGIPAGSSVNADDIVKLTYYGFSASHSGTSPFLYPVENYSAVHIDNAGIQLNSTFLHDHNYVASCYPGTYVNTLDPLLPVHSNTAIGGTASQAIFYSSSSISNMNTTFSNSLQVLGASADDIVSVAIDSTSYKVKSALGVTRSIIDTTSGSPLGQAVNLMSEKTVISGSNTSVIISCDLTDIDAIIVSVNDELSPHTVYGPVVVSDVLNIESPTVFQIVNDSVVYRFSNGSGTLYGTWSKQLYVQRSSASSIRVWGNIPLSGPRSVTVKSIIGIKTKSVIPPYNPATGTLVLPTQYLNGIRTPHYIIDPALYNYTKIASVTTEGGGGCALGNSAGTVTYDSGIYPVYLTSVCGDEYLGTPMGDVYVSDLAINKLVFVASMLGLGVNIITVTYTTGEVLKFELTVLDGTVSPTYNVLGERYQWDIVENVVGSEVEIIVNNVGATDILNETTLSIVNYNASIGSVGAIVKDTAYVDTLGNPDTTRYRSYCTFSAGVPFITCSYDITYSGGTDYLYKKVLGCNNIVAVDRDFSVFAPFDEFLSYAEHFGTFNYTTGSTLTVTTYSGSSLTTTTTNTLEAVNVALSAEFNSTGVRLFNDSSYTIKAIQVSIVNNVGARHTIVVTENKLNCPLV